MKKLAFFIFLVLFIALLINGVHGLVTVALWMFEVFCALFVFFLIVAILINFLDSKNEPSEPDDTHLKNKPTRRLNNYELERFAAMCNSDLKHKDEIAQYEQSSQEQNNDTKPIIEISNNSVQINDNPSKKDTGYADKSSEKIEALPPLEDPHVLPARIETSGNTKLITEHYPRPVQDEHTPFGDLEYRALNKLKNSKINDEPNGGVFLIIDRKDFCQLCLSQELIRYSSIEEDKQLTTVNECKDFLRANSMKISGKKAELTQRISEKDPSFFGNRHYIITEKGMNLLQNHWDEQTKICLNNLTHQNVLLQKLKKYEITQGEFDAYKGSLPFSPFDNDVIWGILNNRQLKYSISRSFSELRDTYLNMALLLEEEKANDRALEYFLMVICFDINGYSPIRRPVLIGWIAKHIWRLQSNYDTPLGSAAYSQCQIDKIYFSEDKFLSLVNDIVTSKKHISYKQTENWLNKYLS